MFNQRVARELKVELEIISYADLLDPANIQATQTLKKALCEKGILGVCDVPDFENKSQAYIQAACQFSALRDEVKEQYAPDRDVGETEGYELGAEWFKDQGDQWQVDDKKASFYAVVPDHPKNKWPHEVDLKTAYQALGQLMFDTSKMVLQFLGVNEAIGLAHAEISGYGRMLHYHQERDTRNLNPNWCGAHFDHGVFTGLMPAYYFSGGEEVDEPEEAGLYIFPTQGRNFEKIKAADKSILLFQVGEFAQLATHDQIRATKHLVKKAKGNIERYTFALFNSAGKNTLIYPQSELTQDPRYFEYKQTDGGLLYGKWEQASYARYRAL